MNKKNLINWSRNCHNDGCIAIKEVKGKRWMSVLSYLEATRDFCIDDFEHNEIWNIILNALNDLSEQEVDKLNNLRREKHS